MTQDGTPRRSSNGCCSSRAGQFWLSRRTRGRSFRRVRRRLDRVGSPRAGREGGGRRAAPAAVGRAVRHHHCNRRRNFAGGRLWICVGGAPCRARDQGRVRGGQDRWQFDRKGVRSPCARPRDRSSGDGGLWSFPAERDHLGRCDQNCHWSATMLGYDGPLDNPFSHPRVIPPSIRAALAREQHRCRLIA